jgi:transposase
LDWKLGRCRNGFFSALAEAGSPVICVEMRHMQAVLKAQINKMDRNDARGIAQMMRVGLYRPVRVKMLRSQKLRTLLTHCKLPAVEGDRHRAFRRNSYLRQATPSRCPLFHRSAQPKSQALQMDQSADQILASVKRFCHKAQQTLCSEFLDSRD